MNPLTNGLAAVVGLALAFVAAFAIVASANDTPAPVEEPLVTYGER